MLRAAIVVGHGGISWEITRQLVEHLPAMVVPQWVATRTQPIAIDDVVRYLVGVLGADEAAGRVFEIGGPDVLRYIEMLQARGRGRDGRRDADRAGAAADPGLSSRWLALVTDVDVDHRPQPDRLDERRGAGHRHRIRDVVPGEPLTYAEAVRRALAEREADPAIG